MTLLYLGRVDLACQDLSPGDFHAAASLRFNDEALSFNFTGPFQFDLEKHEAVLCNDKLLPF